MTDMLSSLYNYVYEIFQFLVILLGIFSDGSTKGVLAFNL